MRKADPDLTTWLAGEAAGIEAAGRIPDHVAARLAAADLFRMAQPKRTGGLGLTLAESTVQVFELARGCGSCAWVVGLNVANLLTVSKLSARAQEEVFGCGEPPCVTVLTGAGASGVEAEHVPGGIRLSGRWRYASGIDVASWVALMMTMPARDGGAGEPYFVLAPKEDFRIDHASWNVTGMRGTGSKDVMLDRAFVPEHRWLAWQLLQAGGKHPDCPSTEPLAQAALTPVNALSVLVPTIGVASALAEEFRVVASGRSSLATASRMRDDKVAQIEAAAGEATMAMLRREVLADAGLIEARANERRALSLEERAALRMRFAVMSRQALATAQRMVALLGGGMLPAGTRIERLARDLAAMSTHFLLQPEAAGEAYGRLLLGLDLPPGARL